MTVRFSSGGWTRRNTLAGGTAAAGVLALAACGPQAPGGSSTAGEGGLAKQKPIGIEFWGGPPSAGQTNGRTDQVAFWNKKNPNFPITFGTTDTVGQGVKAVAPIVAAAAAGNPPDVIDFDRFQSPAFAVKKLWEPLDDLIKRDKYDMNRFAPLIIPEAKGLDGKWYALIRSTDDRLIWWNKEVFQDAGLDPEKPPTTWEELRQYAIRITRKGPSGNFDRIGFHTEEGQSHYHIFAWQNGGSFQTADGKKATLNLAANQEALQWMTDLMRDLGGWDALKTFRSSWGKDAQAAFLIGQLGMFYSTNGYAGGTIAKFRPELKFGAAAPPVKKAGDKPLTWSGGFAYNMIRESKKHDVAWEFMKWLISEEGWIASYDGDLARAKAVGGVYQPGMTGQPDLDKKMFEKYKTGIPAVDKAPDIAVSLMQVSRVREPSIAAQDLWDGIKNAQTEAISQAKGAKQALEDNQAQVQKALDDAWANAPK